MQIFQGLTHAVLHVLHAYGIPGLFVLLVIEEAGVPLPAPGDTLIALAGAQPDHSLMYVAQVLGLCSLAVFIGSSALYWAMRIGGRSFLDRYGRYFRVNSQRMDRVEAWILQRGTLAIVLGRLIPGLRVPTTVICGLSRVPYRVYAPSAALAGLVWSGIYFFLGVLLQRRIGVITSSVVGALDTIGDSTVLSTLTVAVVIVALIGVWHAYRRWRGRQVRSVSAPAVSAETSTRS